MAKESAAKGRNRAVKKLDKAVKKAMKKGVPEDVLEQTVNEAMESTVTKRRPAKRRIRRPSLQFSPKNRLSRPSF